MNGSGFNELTKWSNLARLASGNLPKLTIVAPFIAFIIFHNEPLQPILSLSPARDTSGVMGFLARARFDVFYLGLVVIGLGVATFTLCVPHQITGQGDYEGFILFKERTKTTNGVVGSLKMTATQFLRALDDHDDLKDETGGSLRYPRRFREGLLTLIRSAARVARTDAPGQPVGHLVQDDDADVGALLRSLGGDDEAARAERAAIMENLDRFSIDVFRLEYLAADYARPTMRGLVFWLIVTGTAVALVPTVITTFLVLSDLFGLAA